MEKIVIWEKNYLTLDEAAEYFHIGINRLREIVKTQRSNELAVTFKRRILIKRVGFENYLDTINELKQ